MRNFYLGDTQNAVQNVGIDGTSVEDATAQNSESEKRDVEQEVPLSRAAKIARIFRL